MSFIYHTEWLVLENQMESNRTNTFIIVSSAALLILLIIQVSWIYKTARVKEDMFNEKESIVLARTAEAIGADKETCREIRAYIHPVNGLTLPLTLGTNETHK